jgi:hypothetical protein
MKNLFRTGALALLLVTTGFAKEQVETVFLFQNRQVLMTVPDGLGFASTKDENGMMIVRVADQKEKLSLEMVFLPDPEGYFTSARNRKEFLNETFQRFVSDSVEKSMQFEELEPRVGAGTYCVFTDSNLVGKTKLPAGQFIHSIAGVKAWPGVRAVFEIYCQDTKSKEYLAVLKMLRDSVQEKPSPLL